MSHIWDRTKQIQVTEISHNSIANRAGLAPKEPDIMVLNVASRSFCDLLLEYTTLGPLLGSPPSVKSEKTEKKTISCCYFAEHHNIRRKRWNKYWRSRLNTTVFLQHNKQKLPKQKISPDYYHIAQNTFEKHRFSLHFVNFFLFIGSQENILEQKVDSIMACTQVVLWLKTSLPSMLEGNSVVFGELLNFIFLTKNFRSFQNVDKQALWHNSNNQMQIGKLRFKNCRALNSST